MLMISRDEVLMGRDQEFPLTPELESNLDALMTALNAFRTHYAVPMTVSSGYRPGHYNKDAGGAKNSSHTTCEACDFHDPSGLIDAYCTANLDILEECGLYLEDPGHTVGWSHLTTRAPASGKRVFIP